MKIKTSQNLSRNLLIAYALFAFIIGITLFIISPGEFGHLLGLVFICFSVASFIAKFEPENHWPSVLLFSMIHLTLALYSLKLFISNEARVVDFSLLFVFIVGFVWLIPFYYLLSYAYSFHTMEFDSKKNPKEFFGTIKTSQNKTLLELSLKQNVLLVFVRHFGCTFCRETVSEIARIDQEIKKKNYHLVYVHMSDPSFGDEFFSKYYNESVHHISDPGRLLYKSFNLTRGSLWAIFGPMTWIKGLYFAVFKGHGLGDIEGDSLQLGGVFVLSKGEIIYSQKSLEASDTFTLNRLPEI